MPIIDPIIASTLFLFENLALDSKVFNNFTSFPVGQYTPFFEHILQELSLPLPPLGFFGITHKTKEL